jgi:CubicO group peptidase (beta-lactamase class C family)
MSNLMHVTRWLPVVAVACGGGDPANQQTLHTASGATLVVATGWRVERLPDRLRVTAPEGDLTWTHVELPAADRDAALAAAWARAAPGLALAVAQDKQLPASDGWDATSQIKYAPADGKVALAIARRRAATWYLDLVAGASATFDRRRAQLLSGVKSLTVPGVAQESFAGATARAIDEAKLDEFVTRAMQTANVPGVALAIVERGKVAVLRGWGVRELGKPERVGPDTLFMIGSTSKALTTLMMARLVEAGAVRWKTPVHTLLPEFAVGDARLTQALTLRDTVCMCSGMPGDDDWMFSFDYARATPEERIADLKAIAPTTRPGETWQYSNQLVATGGFAAARARARGGALGPAYDRAMAELVFAPLGMTATTFDFARVARAEHATSHARDLRGALAAQPLSIEENAVAVRPAGGAWSTARDLARVLQLELGGGAIDGARVVATDTLLARRAPQVRVTGELAYGLGLFVERDHGVTVVGHPGNNVGFTTDFFFLPEHGVGVAVLIDSGDANAFRTALRRRLMELWFDGRPRAEPELAAAVAAERAQASQYASALREPEPGWLDPLLGPWVAPHLGRIELRRDNGVPVLDAGEWKVAIAEEHSSDASRHIVTTGAPWPGLVLTPRGDTLTIDQHSQQTYTFVRTR